MNRNERMEKLNNAGINTEKYFTLELPNGLKPGAKIALMIDDNGNPMVVADNYNRNNTFCAEDYISKQILEDGYVRNTRLHRRFVMAQMFYMLNYVSWDGKYRGYNECLKRMYGYDYTLKMMVEEVRVLSKLEARDKESFEERSHFFTKAVVVEVLEDYLKKLEEYIEGRPTHKCKGVPYKKIKGKNIFCADLDKKVYANVRSYIYRVNNARNYSNMYYTLNEFMRDMIKLPYDTPKSKAWIDAYKGEGAYYTLKNLVMFHNCGIKVGKFDVRFSIEAMDILKYKLNEYHGQGWRMFALMKKVIEDNNFDFNKRMKEIYNQ